MRVLVIAGCYLPENTSAHLCHISYIEGLLSLGHTVDLLTGDSKIKKTDNGITIPKGVNKVYLYNRDSLYETLAVKKGNDPVAPIQQTSDGDNLYQGNRKTSLKGRVFNFAKSIFRNIYGIYNPTISWHWKAKKFRSDIEYDLVISLSYPNVSHLNAKYLIEKKHIRTKKWIQLWEDPWTTDPLNTNEKIYNKCYKAEAKLLDSDCEIVYVSPMTMLKQQEVFSKNKEKMSWFPLPSYYETDITKKSFEKNCYGYFGDYAPQIRNLIPFYNVAVKTGIEVNICGSPYGLISDKNNVKIHPRMPLTELKEFEDKTNVLICLFNLGGGQIPGKIYQYAASNKMIIAILDGNDDEKKIIKDYFSQFNRFIFCENNEDSIEEAVKKIESGQIEGISNEPLNAFSAENIVKKLLEV